MSEGYGKSDNQPMAQGGHQKTSEINGVKFNSYK